MCDIKLFVRIPPQVYEDPSEVFSVPLGDAPESTVKIVLNTRPKEENPNVVLEIVKLEACVHREYTFLSLTLLFKIIVAIWTSFFLFLL